MESPSKFHIYVRTYLIHTFQMFHMCILSSLWKPVGLLLWALEPRLYLNAFGVFMYSLHVQSMFVVMALTPRWKSIWQLRFHMCKLLLASQLNILFLLKLWDTEFNLVGLMVPSYMIIGSICTYAHAYVHGRVLRMYTCMYVHTAPPNYAYLKSLLTSVKESGAHLAYMQVYMWIL